MSEEVGKEKVVETVAEVVAAPDVEAGAPAAKRVEDNPTDMPAIDLKNLSDSQLVAYLQLQALAKDRARYERQLMKGKDVEKQHKFWNTQPVLQLKEEVDQKENSAIDTKTTLADIRQEPLNMPAGFEWKAFDIMDPVEAEEVYCLLRDNYVEDDDCTFRFDYSIPFLQWALTPPGYLKEWHVGVRSTKTGALMGMITSIPVHTRVHDKVVPMAEINFLCVHKKLRAKRLAPVLIKEITRRVNLTDIWQAVYTAGVVLPRPVARCRYWHRSLNPKKLIEARFSSLPPKTTMQSHLKNLKLPARVSNSHLRAMTADDVPAVFNLLNEYLDSTTNLAQKFSIEEVAHVLVPRAGVINSYVVEAENGSITDFASFYHLPSTIIGNERHKKLVAVYSYYNVARTVSMTDLVRDLMVLARDEGADVFNALDLMQNSEVFEELKFGSGDGFLQFYLYNWKCAEMPPAQVGIVLL
mmetsp:Transcript_4720/g.9572  ORF Transcript_4720/g.9572 Transcript_4720/m.9572 type:complete len:468 (-) Transcript_4720:302-1705(-)|eukprot:CAMPEP_0170409642 /NCGR_PEP_ID=MMETSP0117_2-20130122/29452_1 /TAXON_ID=400756 /ORGANISM="Durinskia baltica, Strain CSIRO CS-38" /LENGTH=467 /DNA_ID=CAMNT_0010667095 /DNA_START=40 /DNA_END=1443 /DNA_ORIENTATION=+